MGIGTISFDYRISARPSEGGANPYEVQIISLTGDMMIWTAPNPDRVTDWVHFEVPLTPDHWTVIAGTFESVLSDVEFFRIRIRMFTNTEPAQVNDIDNVILSVPEPASWLVLSLAGLVLLRRKNLGVGRPADAFPRI